MLALETTELTKTFRGKVTALDNVSLSVDTGHIFGLLGPNGAGKTTLTKILLGVLYPTSGSAKILEKPINNIRIKEKIGYLPENHRYPDFLKGGQVLDYFASVAGVSKSEIDKRRSRLLKMVDMDEWAGKRIRKYSKGMLQRLGLAQALINDPDILFLDEPTDGVDPIGRRAIRDILRRLQEEGKTIFINSHLLSEVEMICDQVAILDKGKLLSSGTVEELTSPSKKYRFQTSGISDEVVAGLNGIALKVERQDGAIEATCSSIHKLNAVIDYLRQHEVEIKSIMPHKRTLEESFLEILKKDVIN